MKMPELNKVEPMTIYNASEEIERSMFYDGTLAYRSEAQKLIDRFIPDGWRLSFDDVDKDAFNGLTAIIRRAFDAADELNSCYVSRQTRCATEKVKWFVVRNFTAWLSKQFMQYGEEAK